MSAVEEVVCVHSVRTVWRTDWNNVVVGTLCWEPYSHRVITERIDHKEKENGCGEKHDGALRDT